MGITHSTAADGSFSSTGATSWNADHNFVETGSSTVLTIGAIPTGYELTRSGTVLKGKIDPASFVYTRSDSATGTTTALVTASGMTFAVTTGNYYRFSYHVLTRIGAVTSATTVGIKLGLTFPSATVVAAFAQIPQGADGTSHMFMGQITSSGDSVTSASTQFPNTVTHSLVEGTIVPSAAGNVALVYGCELSTTAGVVIKQGTNGRMEKLN